MNAALYAGNADWPIVRRRMGRGETLFRPPREVSVTVDELAGVPTETITYAGPPRATTLLYLHGGVFVTGAPQTHRPIATYLARAMRATVHVLDYRLAPEHPYPAANDDVFTAYAGLIDRGVRPEDIAVVGDSAGGGLALDLAMRARDRQLPQPAVLGLICPFPDWSPDSAAFGSRYPREPMLSANLLARGSDAYLPNTSAQQRRALSPLHRDLTGLPPIVLQSAGDDPLADDAHRLAELARRSDISLRHHHYPGLWHVFHSMPTLFAPARQALDELATALDVTMRDRLPER